MKPEFMKPNLSLLLLFAVATVSPGQQKVPFDKAFNIPVAHLARWRRAGEGVRRLPQHHDGRLSDIA